MSFDFKVYAVVDACGKSVKIARVENGRVAAELETGEPAMESFCGALARACPNLSEVGAFMLCTGPGSVLGARTASVACCCAAKIFGAKIFEWDSMKVSALALAERGERDFVLLAPSRKGFANAAAFVGGSMSFEKEIPLADIKALAADRIFLLDQREKVADELSEFERVDICARELAETLAKHSDAALVCDAPPDAKSPTKREYVKWKAQVHI